MEDRDILHQIVQGQATVAENLRALTETVNDTKKEIRSMRDSMVESNQDLSLAKAEIKYLRETVDKLQTDNDNGHGIINSIIKEQVESAWNERRRCKDERTSEKKEMQEEIDKRITIAVEKLRGRSLLAILVYALSILGFLAKEIFFK